MDLKYKYKYLKYKNKYLGCTNADYQTGGQCGNWLKENCTYTKNGKRCVNNTTRKHYGWPDEKDTRWGKEERGHPKICNWRVNWESPVRGDKGGNNFKKSSCGALFNTWNNGRKTRQSFDITKKALELHRQTYRDCSNNRSRFSDNCTLNKNEIDGLKLSQAEKTKLKNDWDRHQAEIQLNLDLANTCQSYEGHLMKSYEKMFKDEHLKSQQKKALRERRETQAAAEEAKEKATADKKAAADKKREEKTARNKGEEAGGKSMTKKQMRDKRIKEDLANTAIFAALVEKEKEAKKKKKKKK